MTPPLLRLSERSLSRIQAAGLATSLAFLAACLYPTASKDIAPVTVQMLLQVDSTAQHARITDLADGKPTTLPVSLTLSGPDGTLPLIRDSDGFWHVNMRIREGADYHLLGTVDGRAIAASVRTPRRGPTFRDVDTLRFFPDGRGYVDYDWSAPGGVEFGSLAAAGGIGPDFFRREASGRFAFRTRTTAKPEENFQVVIWERNVSAFLVRHGYEKFDSRSSLTGAYGFLGAELGFTYRIVNPQ